MDIAEWNNKVGYILSFLSSLSRRVRTNAAKMHHVVKTWCIVSMSGRFARSAPSVGSAGGAFLPFSRSSVYLSPISIVPVRRDELRENVLRLLRARTIAVIGKIQILFHKLFFIFCR